MSELDELELLPDNSPAFEIVECLNCNRSVHKLEINTCPFCEFASCADCFEKHDCQ